MSRGKQKPDEECRLIHFGLRMTEAEKAAVDRAVQAERVPASELARRDWLEPIVAKYGQPEIAHVGA